MSTDTLPPDPRGPRSLRLASGTALCLAISFGLGLPVPMLAPVMAVFLFASVNRPLPLRTSIGLPLAMLVTTGSGLLLTPLLRHYAVSGVLLIGLCVFLTFRWGLRGGNALVGLFLVAGLTLVPAAGTFSLELGVLLVEALTKGVLVAVSVLALGHVAFPEPRGVPPPPPPPALPPGQTDWIAARATLVVMPAVLLAVVDPLGYLPIILKTVSLGQQSCTTATHGAARELIGSTLLAGLAAILFWFALGLAVNLWMYFLWMLLFALAAARKLYRLSPTRQPPGYWVNTLVTLIILLGQSVEDSIAGQDVYTAFAVRMGLFIGVSLYACLMMVLLDRPRRGLGFAHLRQPTTQDH